MEKVIYKYALNPDDAPEIANKPPGQPFILQMAKGAEILAVQPQLFVDRFGINQINGMIWALCNPSEKEKEQRVFMLVQTGQVFEKPDSATYIATYQLFHGKFILHLFEIKQ